MCERLFRNHSANHTASGNQVIVEDVFALSFNVFTGLIISLKSTQERLLGFYGRITNISASINRNIVVDPAVSN